MIPQAATITNDFEASPLLASERERLNRAYGAARRRDGSPYRTFDREFAIVLGTAEGLSPSHQLELYRRASEKFELWARDTSTWPTTRFNEEQGLITAQSAAAAAQAQATGRAFSAPAFLAALYGRGLSVTLDGDGIVITGAVALNQTDRDLLRNHRDAVVTLLNSKETF